MVNGTVADNSIVLNVKMVQRFHMVQLEQVCLYFALRYSVFTDYDLRQQGFHFFHHP